MNKLQNQKGFTIIEVVLVLAIAGLIFLMVFVALPALQRNQRDTARKNDASTVVAAINSFKSNSRGELPDQGELIDYVDTLSEYDKEDAISVRDNAALPSEDGFDEILVIEGHKCDGGKAVPGTSRQMAVLLRLESGNGAVYCTES